MREPRDINELFRGLVNYAEDSDRTDPRRFVGREREMDRLVRTVARVASFNPPGATTVVHGMPGVGKTSLSKEFQQRINEAPMAGKTVLTVEVDCADFDLPPLNLVQKIASHLSPHMELLPLRTRWRRWPPKVSDAADLKTCINAYAGRVWAERAVIVLVADEFQACPVSDHVRAALRTIDSCEHESRIQLILFGLPKVTSLLRDDLGLPRMTGNTEMPLGPLIDSEGREVVAQTLQALGLSVGNPAWSSYLRELGVTANDWIQWKDALADRIAEESMNFPQHLTAGLLATARALIDARGKVACGARLQADIIERFEGIKSVYYSRRIGPLERHSMALGALSCMEDGAVPEGVAVDLLMAGAEGRGASLSREQAIEVLQAAVGRYVIDSCDGVYAASSIPSMRYWLTAAFAQGVREGRPDARAIVERHEQRLPEFSATP